MKTKHTSGPWEQHANFIYSGNLLNGLIATVHDCMDVNNTAAAMAKNVSVKEGQANTTLIAAAPELVEAGSLLLRTVWDTLRHGLTPGQYEALEEAGQEFLKVLKKAKGGQP